MSTMLKMDNRPGDVAIKFPKHFPIKESSCDMKPSGSNLKNRISEVNFGLNRDYIFQLPNRAVLCLSDSF
jgi:hypothetical protein